MKIALIAGHDSYGMGGAVAYGVSENVFWNDFIRDLTPLLVGNEVKVFHRPEQKPRGYSKAMRELHAEIDHWGADVDIEMHFNAATATAQGHEVLHYITSTNGKRLAGKLNLMFNKHLDNSNRGVKGVRKGDRGSYGLKVGKSVSILSEAFFGLAEIDKYLEGEGRDQLLLAYASFLNDLAN